jgi:hypothetical protein
MRCASLLLAAGALLAACDDTGAKDGARGSCASGGALAGCEDSERTSEGVCWRLVECGAIPLEAAEDRPFDLDWGSCVDDIEDMPDERGAIVIACIASSTCDELLSLDDPACFDYGAQ